MSTAVVQEPVQPVELGAVAGYGEKNESMEEIEGAYHHHQTCDVADIDQHPPYHHHKLHYNQHLPKSIVTASQPEVELNQHHL